MDSISCIVDARYIELHDTIEIDLIHVRIFNNLFPLVYDHAKGSNNYILQSRVRPRMP
jgi:hypothetical protein